MCIWDRRLHTPYQGTRQQRPLLPAVWHRPSDGLVICQRVFPSADVSARRKGVYLSQAAAQLQLEQRFFFFFFSCLRSPLFPHPLPSPLCRGPFAYSAWSIDLLRSPPFSCSPLPSLHRIASFLSFMLPLLPFHFRPEDEIQENFETCLIYNQSSLCMFFSTKISHI